MSYVKGCEQNASKQGPSLFLRVSPSLEIYVVYVVSSGRGHLHSGVTGCSRTGSQEGGATTERSRTTAFLSALTSGADTCFAFIFLSNLSLPFLSPKPHFQSHQLFLFRLDRSPGVGPGSLCHSPSRGEGTDGSCVNLPRCS